MVPVCCSLGLSAYAKAMSLCPQEVSLCVCTSQAPGDPQPVLQGVIGIDVRQMSQPNYLDVARAAAAQIAGWHNTSSMAPATAGARM